MIHESAASPRPLAPRGDMASLNTPGGTRRGGFIESVEWDWHENGSGNAYAIRWREMVSCHGCSARVKILWFNRETDPHEVRGKCNICFNESEAA